LSVSDRKNTDGIGALKCRTGRSRTWNTNNEFHIYACVTLTDTYMWFSGAINIKDYTQAVTLEMTRAQIVSCL